MASRGTTWSVPLGDNPNYHKDLRVGQVVKILTTDAQKDKYLVYTQIMVSGEPVDAKDWIATAAGDSG